MTLKDQVKQWQIAKSPAKRWAYPVAKAVWRTWQFISMPELRSQRITYWRYREHHCQRSTFTEPNRYPELFEQCKTHLQNTAEPKILSFGCATGDEVFSLAEYMPNAIVIGVDINAWCIRQCNSRKSSDKYRFLCRFSAEFEQTQDLDAIFCMAVFQRTENRTNSDNAVSMGITFDQFEREIGQLDAKLKPGGLLFIDHADFDFMDTVHAERYDVLEFEQNRVHYKRPLFDRCNRKVSDEQWLYRVFVKRR